MKNVIMMISIMLLSIASFGQQMVVDEKDLPQDLVQQLKQKQQTQQVTQQLQTVSEWAGIGKEVGGAIREGLTAVKDVAVDFSKTDVGTFTMVLIAWKVVGHDVLNLAVGLLVFTVGISFIVWSFRRTVLSRRVLIEDGGWFKSKKYQIVESPYSDSNGNVNVGLVQFIHGIALFALIGISVAIIF